ncbi:hypothetical protein K439DRAFT_1616521 [Ramaria rubella]|nr:hypothetical protein K439DRAFT_1616521 [Ramaria rubella]
MTHISVFQNPHINTVDDGDHSIILLAAIAVSLKRPSHVFSAGDDSELHNIKIPPLRASHSLALQVHSRAASSHVIHHRYPPFTVGGKSINGEYSGLEVENAEDELVHKTEVNTLMKTVLERMPLNMRFETILVKAKSSAIAKWWRTVRD